MSILAILHKFILMLVSVFLMIFIIIVLFLPSLTAIIEEADTPFAIIVFLYPYLLLTCLIDSFSKKNDSDSSFAWILFVIFIHPVGSILYFWFKIFPRPVIRKYKP